jgi:oligopeptide transport system substrate-binding protein
MEPIQGVKEYRNKKVNRSAVGLKALNKETLEITLTNQAPYLKALLATTPLAAIHLSFRDTKNSFKEKNIISSGPFVIKDFSTDKVLLQKNKWYRSYDSVQSDYIEILMADQAAVEKQYKENKLHWSLAYIPLQILNSPLDLHIGPEYSTGFYYFSAKEGPYANNRIREALSLFIPWDELRKESRQIFLTKNLIPGNSDAPENLVDENRAYKILAEEGFPYGAGLPSLHMAVHRGSQIFESAKLIADLWSLKLGITVVLDVVPLSLYSRYPEYSPYDFAFITWIGDIHDPFAFLTLFKGDSGYNLGNYSDEVYDRLLEEALATDNDQERSLIIDKAEQRLLTQKAIFPIYHGITTNIVATDLIDGWYDNILNIHPLQYLTLKK